MTELHRTDPAIAAWLASGPDHLPIDVVAAIEARTTTTADRVKPSWPTPRFGGVGRLSLVGIAAALVIALVGLLFASGAPLLRDDGPRIVGPSVSEGPLPSPDLAGTPDRFHSALYGYALVLPNGAKARAARTDWAAGLVDDRATADLIVGEGWRLTVISTVPAAGVTASLFARTFMPVRAVPSMIRTGEATCIKPPAGGGSQVRRYGVGEWASITISTAKALVRAACGYVDAVVSANRRLYAITYFTGVGPDGDVARFREVVSSITFDPAPIEAAVPREPPTDPVLDTDPPALRWNVMWRSDRYGYTIRHSQSWTVEPSAKAGEPDRLASSKDQYLLIHAERLPSGVSAVDWANDHLPDRATTNGTHRHCEWRGGGIIAVEGPPGPSFTPINSGGHPMAVRSLCGFVDGVIDQGDQVLVLTLHTSARRATGDRWTFDQFMRTLVLDPRP